jgi:phosphate transport system substrate-binding protein
MKKPSNFLLFLSVAVILSFAIFQSCKKYNDISDGEETIIKGNATILVDESLQSIVDAQIMVFESQYAAKIKQINQSETSIVNDLIAQKHAIAVLSRKLTDKELAVFKNKQIQPRITQFATDAVVFVVNSKSNDTVFEVSDVYDFLKNKPSVIKNMTFESANSSTQSFLSSLAGVTTEKQNNIFSEKNYIAVLKHVQANQNAIGVIGLNQIVEPTAEVNDLLKNVKVVSVRNVKKDGVSQEAYKPSQDNIGSGLYPFERPIFMLNFQGRSGLGMGFASFVAGEIGQRIVLKSGLMPVRMPSRIINTRKGILK